MVREQLLQLVVILHVIYLRRILACAPTPPPPSCIPPNGTAGLIFNTADVQLNDTTLGYNNITQGQTAPNVGECACTSGATEYYYTGSTITDWNSYLNGSIPLIMTLDCKASAPNNPTAMCVCVTENECYTRSAAGMSAALAPVCIGGKCDVYMFVQGPQGSQMDPVIGGGTPIYADGQFVGNDLMPLPDGYAKIRSISCKGCSNRVPTTCT